MIKRNQGISGAKDDAAAIPVLPQAPSLLAIDGGRAALERELMWAAGLGQPDYQSLLRRLTPSANDGVQLR